MIEPRMRKHLRFLIFLTLINAPLQWALTLAFTH